MAIGALCKALVMQVTARLLYYYSPSSVVLPSFVRFVFSFNVITHLDARPALRNVGRSKSSRNSPADGELKIR